MSEKTLLTLYLNVGELEAKDIEELCASVSKSLFPKDLIDEANIIVFIIPVRNQETRIECISPKFIVDIDVYEEHKHQMTILNKNINTIINQGNL